jgi:GrpB-like predicted nucleotidyltransferase (UPF0157 family)
MLGLKLTGPKSHMIEVHGHKTEWDESARIIISSLKMIFGKIVCDIQHVGSTAIRHIKAKPIIDIAVGIKDFDMLTEILPHLETHGIFKSLQHEDDIMLVINDIKNNTRTHNIHVVIHNGNKWHSYIGFRDYLNAHPEKARAYEDVKIRLAKLYPDDLRGYSHGKDEVIKKYLNEAKEVVL